MKHATDVVYTEPFVIHNLYIALDFDTVILTVHRIRELLPQPETPKPPPAIITGEPRYTIADTRDRGKGLFATRYTPAGVPVMVEAPSIILPFAAPPSVDWSRLGGPPDNAPETDPAKAPKNHFEAVFKRAWPKQRKALLDLYNC